MKNKKYNYNPPNFVIGSDMQPKKKASHFYVYKIIGFFLALTIVTIVSFILPLRPSFSESEKRELAKFPKFTASSLVDGAYFDDINTWFSDTFPAREALTTLNGKIQRWWGISKVSLHGDQTGEKGDEIPDEAEQPTTPLETPSEESSTIPPTTEKEEEIPNMQTLNYVLIIGDSGYEYYSFLKNTSSRYVGVVNRAAQLLKGKAQVYSMVIPTSIDILLPDNVKSSIDSSNQKKALEYINGSMSSDVKPIKIYDTLIAHKKDYIYFRTDHHWTALGAYYAYTEAANAAGFTPSPLDKFDKVTYDGFIGSFYSDTKSPNLSKNPDSVIAYKPFSNASMKYSTASGEMVSWPIICNVSDSSASMKYSTFIAGDQPYTVINNKDLSDGSSCLIIKDSFANAIIPFFVSHYQNIYIVDARYYKSDTLTGLVSKNNIKDVFFINNISATRNDYVVGKTENFVK